MYVFSQFQTAHCHKVFPSFDQPDLKASWSFRAVVPGNWKVISNEQVINHTDTAKNSSIETLDIVSHNFHLDHHWIDDDSKFFQFAATPRISTYLYGIMAGPYESYESNLEELPPMKIYARKSLIQEVNHEEMFMITQSSVAFFKELFNQSYPFTKFDQIFVPEFQSGGMENVGIVTLSEDMLFKGKKKTAHNRL